MLLYIFVVAVPDDDFDIVLVFDVAYAVFVVTVVVDVVAVIVVDMFT